MKHESDYRRVWQAETADYEAGPEEGEVTLTVRVIEPERRAGRRIRITMHRDQLHDLLILADQ